MPPRSEVLRLNDIVDAIDVLMAELEASTIESFGADVRKRWIVERGIEIISEASRHLSDDLKSRHPRSPWRRVADIGNVLRHAYETIAYDLRWYVVQHDFTRVAGGVSARTVRGRRLNEPGCVARALGTLSLAPARPFRFRSWRGVRPGEAQGGVEVVP